MCSARVADRLAFALIMCCCMPNPVPIRDSSRPTPNIMGTSATCFGHEKAESQIGGPVHRSIGVVPGRLKYIDMNRQESPGPAGRQMHWRLREGGGHIWGTACVRQPQGTGPTVDTNCFKEAEESWGSPRQLGLEAQHHGDYAPGSEVVGHIHPCGVGT